MSLNANSSARAQRTTNLPAGDFTVAGWFRVLSWGGAQFQCLLQVEVGSADREAFITIDTSAGRVQYFFWNGTTSAAADLIADATPGGWLYCALSRTGTTIKARVLRSTESTFTAATQASWNNTINRIYVWSDTYAEHAEQVLARYVRVFSAELSDAQLLAEARSTTPVLTASLNAAHVFGATSGWGTDTSGNGYALTETGTPTTNVSEPADVTGTRTGNLALTLAAASLSATAQAAITATATPTLTGVLPSSTATVAVSGALSSTLGGAVLSATGVTEVPGVTANLSTALDATTLSASANVALAGGLSRALDGAALTSLAALRVSGALSSSLQGASLNAAAQGGVKVFVMSNSIGDGNDDAPPASAYALVGSLGLVARIQNCEVYDYASDGAETDGLIAGYAANILANKSTTKRNIILFREGVNSLYNDPGRSAATELAAIEAFAAVARADGFEFVTGSLMPVGDAPTDTRLQQFNTLLRASTAFDGIIDGRRALPQFSPVAGNPLYSPTKDAHFSDGPGGGYDVSTEYDAQWLRSYLVGHVADIVVQLAGASLAASAALGNTVTGNLSSSLGGAALSASARATLAATATLALDGTALGAAANVAIRGALARTLDGASPSCTAVVPIAGTVAQTLDGAGLSSTASAALLANSAIGLSGATLSASAISGLASVGQVVLALDGVGVDASARLAVSAQLQRTLDGAALASSCSVALRGVLGVDLGGARLTATGFTVIGNDNEWIGRIPSAAQLSVAPVSRGVFR